MIAADMAQRCPDAREIGSVVLPGWRLVIGRKGFATIVRQPGARVMGVLWSLTPQCERILDEFEEIGSGLFRRETIDVEGEPTLVYIAADPAPGPPRAPYLKTVIAAAEARSFPSEYIEELRLWLSRA
jgi:hypothetical protein